MKKKILKKVLSFSVALAFLLTNAQIISGAPGTGSGTDPQCTSGGPGSTSCSGSWTIAGTGVSCSVTCSSGYYACCYLSLMLDPKCVCKKSSKQNMGGAGGEWWFTVFFLHHCKL